MTLHNCVSVQAAAAVIRAYEAGVRRHKLELLLPQAGNTSAQGSWPGGIRQQAQVAIPSLIEPLLKQLKQHPNLQVRPRCVLPVKQRTSCRLPRISYICWCACKSTSACWAAQLTGNLLCWQCSPLCCFCKHNTAYVGQWRLRHLILECLSHHTCLHRVKDMGRMD